MLCMGIMLDSTYTCIVNFLIHNLIIISKGFLSNYYLTFIIAYFGFEIFIALVDLFEI